MSNPTFKPSEGKREEFRNYLEKNGVMDALTKVLVNLYEEPDKPENALEYVREKLAVQAGIETYSEMKKKLEEYTQKIDELTEKLVTKQAEVPVEAEETQNDAVEMEVTADEVEKIAEEATPEAPPEEEKREEPNDGVEVADQVD